MPLPIPFYLRTSQTAALTHAQLDGNLSILSTKIDNTTCNNVGAGVGIFESKQIGANDGIINLYSLSGTNGISVGVSGTTLVIDGGGAADSDWVTNGNDIYNGNTGNVGIGAINPKTKLELYSTGNTVAINNILRFSDNDTVITSFQEQFIGKIEFHSNENSGNGGVKSYIGGVQDSAAGSSIIFATTGGTAGTLEGTNPQDLIGERMRIDPVGNVGIGTSAPTKRLHISGDTLSEGDISLPDNHKLRIGDSSDLQIYHDGASSRIAEVGTGNLLISGTEVWLSDSTTGKSFLRTYSAQGKIELKWSGETRMTTSEDGLILNKTISGTPVANLSVRADGTIITGSTVPVGTSFSTDASIDPNVSIYDTISYTTTSPGGTIYIGDSNSFPVGHKKTLIRISTTNSAFIGTTGSSTINGSATKALPTAVYSVTTCIANGNVWYCSTGTVL